MPKRAALTAAALFVALPVAGARAEDDPCTRFVEPLAYNSCLASHGPKAGAVRTFGGSPPNDNKGSGAGAPPRPRLQAPARPHGRVHMEFQVR